jgi:hypothetical protein
LEAGFTGFWIADNASWTHRWRQWLIVDAVELRLTERLAVILSLCGSYSKDSKNHQKAR